MTREMTRKDARVIKKFPEARQRFGEFKLIFERLRKFLVAAHRRAPDSDAGCDSGGNDDEINSATVATVGGRTLRSRR
jgi:hypothetical protein